ncbi:ABC transporter [Opitutaceae bacterium EW11]|nr:ABC transporter [Opitutaceae bacterium EW11]
MPFSESFRAARWVRTVNLILQAVLVVTLVGGLNFLALHYGARFDLTKMHKHSLSAETRSYLSQLAKPVLIISTFTESAEDEKMEQAASDLAQLLREYVYATEANTNPEGKIAFQHLDVFRQPRDAQQLEADQNQILVLCGNRRRVIRYQDLYQFKDGVPTAFLGEEAITSAILDVASNTRKKIYFLTGHGELEPMDTRPDRGLSALRDEFSRRNFELDMLDLRERRKVPDDAAMLLSVGPSTAFEPFEEELLRQYLSTRAGRMLLLLGPSFTDHGLRDLLFDWGILADSAVIYNAGNTGQNETGRLILRVFAPHPVTQALIDQKLPVSFGPTRPVRTNPSRGADESLIITQLIASPPTAWGERDPRQNPPRFDKGTDLSGLHEGQGPIVAMASERVGAKAELNFSVPRGRIVVFGCSDFVTNNQLQAGGNLTLVISSLNWLVDRDSQLNIAARPIEKFQIALSQQELLRLRYTLLFGLPGIAAVLGLIVYWTRRR